MVYQCIQIVYLGISLASIVPLEVTLPKLTYALDTPWQSDEIMVGGRLTHKRTHWVNR